MIGLIARTGSLLTSAFSLWYVESFYKPEALSWMFNI